MSFDPPFSHFSPGDLVYGVPQGQSRLIDFFGSQGWCADGREILTSDALGEALASDDGAAPYLLAALREFREAVRSHPKYRDALDARHPLAFRRRTLAKAGLYWATLVAGRNVHYSLEGLDTVAQMRAVARKTAPGEDVPAGSFDAARDTPLTRYTKSRSGVGSELRWIFRHQHVPRVRARVQFWRPLYEPLGEMGETSGRHEPCPPPWQWGDESAAAWTEYRPKRFYSDDDYKEGEPV